MAGGRSGRTGSANSRGGWPGAIAAKWGRFLLGSSGAWSRAWGMDRRRCGWVEQCVGVVPVAQVSRAAWQAGASLARFCPQDRVTRGPTVQCARRTERIPLPAITPLKRLAIGAPIGKKRWHDREADRTAGGNGRGLGHRRCRRRRLPRPLLGPHARRAGRCGRGVRRPHRSAGERERHAPARLCRKRRARLVPAADRRAGGGEQGGSGDPLRAVAGRTARCLRRRRRRASGARERRGAEAGGADRQRAEGQGRRAAGRWRWRDGGGVGGSGQAARARTR